MHQLHIYDPYQHLQLLSSSHQLEEEVSKIGMKQQHIKKQQNQESKLPK
jgi:hypothetical protein